MATVYKVEIVSHWSNINPKRLEEIIKKAINDKTIDNLVEVKAERL
jgi:hypothetical protein